MKYFRIKGIDRSDFDTRTNFVHNSEVIVISQSHNLLFDRSH